MKLFLDSSSNYFILALIDEKNQIIDYKKIQTNNDIVKNSIKYLNLFLEENNIKVLDINEVFITNGPGSFTGVKIPYNIAATLNLVKKFSKIYYINTFELLDNDDKTPCVRFSKNKSYIRKSNFIFWSKINIINNNDIDNEVHFNYDDLNVQHLQNKINAKKFKQVKKLEKIKIQYLNVL